MGGKREECRCWKHWKQNDMASCWAVIEILFPGLKIRRTLENCRYITYQNAPCRNFPVDDFSCKSTPRLQQKHSAVEQRRKAETSFNAALTSTVNWLRSQGCKHFLPVWSSLTAFISIRNVISCIAKSWMASWYSLRNTSEKGWTRNCSILVV